MAVIAALRDFVGNDDSIAELVKMIRDQLGGVNGATATAARYPFSLAFSNLLRCGSITVESDASVGEMNPKELDDFIQAKATPHDSAVVIPLRNRIDKLSENVDVVKRPPQPGDNELQELYVQITNSNQFAIQ